MPDAGRLFTVGHSSRPLHEFLEILTAHGAARVLDVRRFPASRKWPHFNAAELSESLAAAGIGYVSLPELGGRRRPSPDSPHVSWRSDAFRGYADFMDTPEFSAALGELRRRALETPSAVLCAEAVPWRCHRSLIADALVAAGWTVTDILSASESRLHRLPAFARVEGTRVIYDA